jgi:hypothetical protein
MTDDYSAPQRSEKRNHQRVKCSVPAELTGDQAFPIRGETTDVSLSGFYFSTIFALPVGTTLKIKLALAGVEWLAEGVVRTADPGVGNGIEFTSLDDMTKQRLQEYLRAIAEP